MPAITGSITTATSSPVVDVKPGELISINVNILPAQTFSGVFAIQQSLDGGSSWQTIVSPAGVEQRFSGLSVALTAGTVTSFSFKNELTQRISVRIQVTNAGGANGIDFALNVNAGVSSPGVVELVEYSLINAANIIGTAAGQFGHAQGFPLVADPRADQAVELISALMQTDRRTAAYGAGGNVTVNISGGGAALTGVVSAANSLGAAADAVHLFVPLSTAAIALTAGKGLSLVAAAAFTNPGTAAGIVRVRTRYRLHDLSLT